MVVQRSYLGSAAWLRLVGMIADRPIGRAIRYEKRFSYILEFSALTLISLKRVRQHELSGIDIGFGSAITMEIDLPWRAMMYLFF